MLNNGHVRKIQKLLFLTVIVDKIKIFAKALYGGHSGSSIVIKL